MDLRERERQQDGDDCAVRSCVTCIYRHLLLEIHEGKCGVGVMWQGKGKGRTALYAWFYGETRREQTALMTYAR